MPRRFAITDLSGRPWHIRVRAGLPFELRAWGDGHWCSAHGEPHYHPTAEAANAAGDRWINEGVRD